MSITEGKVIALILRERFGPVVEQVGSYLFKNKSSPLLYIKKGTNLPLSKVKESLCILIKFQLVTYKPNRNENIANYLLNSNYVLLMIRYPKYLHFIKQHCGDEAEKLIEEILQRGYWTASEVILKIYERLSKSNPNPPDFTYLKDKIIYLINAKYLIRVPYSDQENPVPTLKIEEKELHAVPNIDIKLLAVQKSTGNVVLPDSQIYWKINFDRFHQDMRDEVIVTAFRKKFDNEIAEIVQLLLRQMYIRTEPWAEVSNPVPILEVKDILKRRAGSNSKLIAFFDQYINLIEQDSSKLIRKSGVASGGSFQIFLKEAFTQFAWELVEQAVLEKYDSKAARIFRLVKLRPYLEPDQIQRYAMIPAKDAKRLSYQLFEDNFLRLQEVRKPSVNNGPMKNFSLFHIDIDQVVRMLLELCYKTLFNLKTRKKHEKTLNRRIIDKKQRVDTIAMGMKMHGAADEQLEEIESMVTPPERELLANVEQTMKKINLAELEIDSTIFLLQLYIMYT